MTDKKKPAPELAKKHWKQCEQCRAFPEITKVVSRKSDTDDNGYQYVL
ncbi:hypothetical protein [Photorhabdus laumondii]|nr:hypothetical protein [Photorhabdus laumondii]